VKIIGGKTPGWNMYEVYDVQACRVRKDIYLADDEANIYGEAIVANGQTVIEGREVKSNRIIIPPNGGTILINALPDSDATHKQQDLELIA
jgi:hypothetical protein